jgi:glutamate carboxypeptidase
MSDLLTYFQNQCQPMIDFLTRLVNYETPTSSKDHVDGLGAFLEAEFRNLGATVRRFHQETVGDCLLAKWNENASGKPIMFLIHIDTVWPVGTLAERPVRIDDEGKLFGPGAIDMKGGITAALWSIKGLIERGDLPTRPIWMLMTGDEETGSTFSTPVIVDAARQCGLVLVMEPATQEEALKTWRKGIATYTVSVEGRASHAGNAPEKGINAVVELAQQTLALHSMNDLRHGTSVSVTMVNGGIAANVIPAQASAKVDVRALTMAALNETHDNIMGLEPLTPGAKVTVENHHLRGPMEHNAQMQADFAQCKAIGERLGLTVREDGSGGGSDGNTTASLGISTLDGLGPAGDGLHAVHEHVILNSLPRRAALLAAMLQEWKFGN